MKLKINSKIEKSKSEETHQPTLLCHFGFELKDRCGERRVKLDLTRIPTFRRLIGDGTIPPHYCTFVNERTALLDQCLACHLEKGYTLQDFKIRFKNHEI
ncbi:MAG: hypothetical protein HY912_24305 [Desulfomonile tiedjei]|uniref:Uncharacterized protein n=1 Tax=Desulfomonile tiedjei TaxID=2358 RepID=A0A9D6Z909_9BACT|nr:hypothetical protein [Desulfomonile tiedjei]